MNVRICLMRYLLISMIVYPQVGVGKEEEASCEDASSRKRRCRTWGDDVHGDAAPATEVVADCTDDVTLELFPLRPDQGKSKLIN